MAPYLPFWVGGGCGPYDPEIVFRELIAALHLDIVSGELGFSREHLIPFVGLSRIAAAVVRARRRHWPTRPVPSIQVLIHAVCPSIGAPRVPHAIASPAHNLQRSRKIGKVGALTGE